MYIACTDSERFVRGGLNFITFFLLFFLSFLVDEGIEDPNITIKRSSSARQRNIENIVDPDQTND